MRIALLSPYTDPVKGGISSYTRELVDGFRRMGMVAIGLAAEGRSSSQFLVLGPSKASFLIRAFLRLASLKPDLIHAHSHWHVLFPGFLVRKVRPRTRLLFTFHTMPAVVETGFGDMMLRRMLRSCDAVTFVSRQLRNALRVPSSVRQAVVYPAPERRASRPRQENARRENPAILFVGPLVWPAKAAGVSRLLEAFAAIAPSYPQWRLVIIGDGPFRTPLEREAATLGLEAKVSFKGLVEDVFNDIAEADVYAQISLQEGVPISVLNAMAMGKPVLASEVGGMPEVITDGVTGRLVPPSTNAIASALSELLGDEGLRRRLGQAARKWISDEFTWEKVAVRHLELVREP